MALPNGRLSSEQLNGARLMLDGPMERYLYLADRVSGQVSSDGKMLESATPPRDIQQVEFIADDDSTSLLEEIPYEKFLPTHFDFPAYS